MQCILATVTCARWPRNRRLPPAQTKKMLPALHHLQVDAMPAWSPCLRRQLQLEVEDCHRYKLISDSNITCGLLLLLSPAFDNPTITYSHQLKPIIVSSSAHIAATPRQTLRR
ncbi:hypothetical protein HRR81_006190 [Exophiala dermatitidis]|nr:hypothetical protein HRR77_007316 [Exophiala dermatitidis]KAJ4566540.1 hypothetical protein HRR82_008587 [Exophiala dermatitidis]KAJ4569716.1 hypothetical protein HRR81_006190 [Exophiala dermatitidis]KAJ4609048.1 hypothetical protein HRR85_007013 [Exophiala dermatitidis]KAJ4613344.1 hypothetical protein HRR86_008673 [Exophiala dermatitidis]